jgi:hypothetical protein
MTTLPSASTQIHAPVEGSRESLLLSQPVLSQTALRSSGGPGARQTMLTGFATSSRETRGHHCMTNTTRRRRLVVPTCCLVCMVVVWCVRLPVASSFQPLASHVPSSPSISLLPSLRPGCLTRTIGRASGCRRWPTIQRHARWLVLPHEPRLSLPGKIFNCAFFLELASASTS